MVGVSVTVGVWGWMFLVSTVVAVDLTATSAGSESMSEAFERWLSGSWGWLPAALWLGVTLHLFWGLVSR